MYKRIFLLLTVLMFSGLLFAQTTKDLEESAPIALKNREFVLYFQPICKFNKNKICGAEVLTRWQKDGRILSPGKFIPLFEQNGFIKQLDVYVFENTLKYLKTWQDKGLQIGFISLNISALDLQDFEIINIFKSLLDTYEIPAEKLIIEITETVEISDKEKAKDFILALKKLGFKIALDDLGDGYATLDAMQNFPYDVIKLSKKLLNDFDSKNTKTQLKQTLSFIKKFSLPIIAEGIENKEEAKFLKRYGANFTQGYLYYKPMPENDFEKLLSNKLPKYCYFK